MRNRRCCGSMHYIYVERETKFIFLSLFFAICFIWAGVLLKYPHGIFNFFFLPFFSSDMWLCRFLWVRVGFFTLYQIPSIY